jgi:hypothetical protein
MIFHINELENWAEHRFDELAGRWVAVRGVPAKFRNRAVAAWLVLTGKADAVTW